MRIEFDEYETPDGLIYEFTDGADGRGLIFGLSNMGAPPVQYQTYTAPNQHGETVTGYQVRPRTVQLLHRRNGQSRYDYWDIRDEFLDFLRVNRQAAGEIRPGIFRKIRPDGSIRELLVYPAAGPDMRRSGGNWDEWSLEENVRWTAYDPFWRDASLNEVVASSVMTPNLVFPITFPIEFGSGVLDWVQNVTYPGTWLARPSFLINGPSTTAIISNLTTGEEIEIAYTITIGQTLTVVLDGQILVYDTTGTSRIGTVTPESDLAYWHLAPDPEAAGGVNTIRVKLAGSNPAVSDVTISWYDKYWGT